MRYVIDASVAVRWFIKGYGHENAEVVLTKIVHEPELFAVPELFLFELFAVLERHHPFALKVYSEDVERLLRTGVLRYPMTENVYTGADRFIRKGLTGYDAVYVSLAEELGGKWLTFDTKAHSKLSGENLSVDLFESKIW